MNNKKYLWVALTLGIGLAGCGGDRNKSKEDPISIAPAIDTNSDPHIFETTIVAAPLQMKMADGQSVNVFAYNGQVPGPEIRVQRGDRVIVHFKNDLPAGYNTTIHWHGVEVNNKSDGTELTQTPVVPGGTYTYDFVAPRAGIFWYHPHIRGTEEVAAGLYAPIVVSQPEEDLLIQQGTLPKDDRTIVLSDLSVENGARRNPDDVPMLETMNGTEGNILLVNGKELPTLSVPEGAAIRLRLINASIARYYRLALPNHDIYRIGGQSGLLEKVKLEGGPVEGMRMAMDETYTGFTGPIQIDQGFNRGEILLAPAERADVVIVPKGVAGDTLTLRWVDFARGRHEMAMDMEGMTDGMPSAEEMMPVAADDGIRESRDLLRIQVRKATGARSLPFAIQEGASLVDAPLALTSQRSDTPIMLQEDMEAMMMDAPKSTWFKIDDFSGVDGRTNFRTASVGETIDWEIHNDTGMHHPFHLHGFSFQPTEYVMMNHEEGYMDMWSINENNEFVDTINVPPHTSIFYKFQINERPNFGNQTGSGVSGDWMLHCHIFQHGDNGMMSFLRVN